MKHRCHARGCEVELPRSLFMCQRHWEMLPEALQIDVWVAYPLIGDRPGPRYMRATNLAIWSIYVAELAAAGRAPDRGEPQPLKTAEIDRLAAAEADGLPLPLAARMGAHGFTLSPTAAAEARAYLQTVSYGG